MESRERGMTTGGTKMRLDLLLVERGVVPSRERARALILAGRVLVREQKVDKAGASVAADAPIRLLGEEQPYVSRGGVKLAAALAPPPAASPIASCSTAPRRSPPSIPASARSP
jgi:ribosomal 50S subunit-recycling heat shock protein